MIDADTVHDLRVTLNAAQDLAKEALVWVKRIPNCKEDDFEFFQAQAVSFATAAVNQARRAAFCATQFAEMMEEL